MSYTGSLAFLFVSDLDRSTEFYESLGLVVLIDQGSCRILGLDETLMVGLCGGRTPSPDDITHAFLRDPDGYLVEIQRFESA